LHPARGRRGVSPAPEGGRQEGSDNLHVREILRDFEQIASFFGKDRRLSAILAAHVGKFMKSDTLLRLPGGKERAKPTVDKTVRVLRMFLVWARETGRIAKLPLPKGAPMGRSERAQETGDEA